MSALSTIFGVGDQTYRQYLAGFICTISVILLGASIGWPAPTIPKLKSDNSPLPMDDSQISWMVSTLYLGNVISPVPTGWLMDRIGRKRSLLLTIIFQITSWVSLLLATQPYHLYIGRFLGGISFGCTYTVVPIYVAEISETRLRGILGSIISVTTYGGALFVYSVGPYVSYQNLIYSCLLIPVIFILTFSFMPESPTYLLIVGKDKKAKKALAWLRINKNEKEIEDELQEIKISTKEQMNKAKGFKDLVSTRGNRNALLIVLGLAIIQRMTGIGALMAYSSITIPDEAVFGLGPRESLTVLGVIWFISSIASTFLIERLGRKFLLSVSAIGCCVSTLAASVWFFLNERTSIDVLGYTWVPFISFMFDAFFYSLGIGPIGSSIKGELFPANVKGQSSAAVTIVMALTSFLLNKWYLIISDTHGMYLNFLIFSVSCLLAIVFVKIFVIETKGKTLSEIQNELNGVKNGENISEP